MTEKMVYEFDEIKGGNTPDNIVLLGNKGAQLAEMNSIGLPVPPGFTITTDACISFYEGDKKWPSGLEKEVKEKLSALEQKTGKKLGGENNPLFLSVRSGSYVSMPGMMDTVLNLGMNEKTVSAFARQTGNKRGAWDSFRRFIQMFGDVVMGIEHAKFEEVLEETKKEKNVKYDVDLDTENLTEVVDKYRELIRSESKRPFPNDPWEQLKMAIDAVFNSWNNNRAVKYRKIHNLRDDAGTGVNVQAMVFGNLGKDCATGVGFTRNPSTGEKEHYGEYLIDAQGEDVVAGIRTPRHIDEMKKDMPDAYRELVKIYGILEKHYKDMQDFEFTVERGDLFLLQTRKAKRTAHAAVKVAVDMEEEGLIERKEAVLRIDPDQLEHLLHKQLDPKAKEEEESVAKGLPASPGAAVGRVVFSAEDAVRMAEGDSDEKPILVRTETSPEDIEGMNAAEGILTSRGGMTCIAGDGIILTNKGFLSAEDAFEMVKEGEKLLILSHDTASGKSKWKPIISTGRRLSDAIEVSFSQTGRATKNTLKMTPDHKILTFNNKDLIKKPISDVLKDGEFVSIVDRMPDLILPKQNEKLAYLAGAILSDGCINLRRTKGSVTFTQKETEEKRAFISTVRNYFNEVFNRDSNIMRTKVSAGHLNDRLVQGEALDMICTSMLPAEILINISDNIVPWVFGLDELSTLNFLAGVIDGDGSFHNGRIQIYVSKNHVKQGVIVACLKLGIVPQVTSNRDIYNIQIVEHLEKILQHTKRATGIVNKRKYGSKLFSIKQLFGDMINDVNYMGRIKEAAKRNLLFHAEKIKRDILPLCKPKEKERISNILNSDLRMYRANKIADLGKIWVYNFEVDSNNEMDKNFVVFSKMYTPVLVSNSHAAVVARGMGKCCVAGCESIVVSEKEKNFRIPGKNNVSIKEGDWLSIDGSTGEVFIGQIDLIEPEISGEFGKLMEWVDEFKRLGVKANADTPHDSEVARKFGAEGIGLCRTEHMFFKPERIRAMREMILAEDSEGRKRALDKILPYQKEDFRGLFRVMSGLPIIIRLLDPPLHEFLPKEEKEIREMADGMGVKPEKIRETIDSLHEFNPMLGFRGCRLSIKYPEITEMQVRAIFEAALEAKEDGDKPLPEIEVPLVGNVREFVLVKDIINGVAGEMGAKEKIKYRIGTMIEVPRAAITADEIAKEADFMSFGTNDLTQMGCGFSRDDSGKFLGFYSEKKIYSRDPFQSIDQEGVGRLMEICVENARKTKPDMEIGICGEHGGEPASVNFCHRIGLTDVSCSPFRVPIARLSAAQAAIKNSRKDG